MFKTYYSLIKPGIIYGNAMTAVAGFLLASKGHVRIGLLLATLMGASLVIASGCVFNNYIDRSIDKKMARTKRRALVSGKVSGRSALMYATVLGVAGFLILALGVNALVVGIGVIGLLDYVIFYGIAKRRSVYGTLVGSISGATPVVAGYCAVTGHFDAAALILFFILAIWQMPHFYAIATYRHDDYAAASLPVLPVIKSMRITKLNIAVYIAGFVLATAALSIFGYAGYTYLGAMVLIGLAWLRLAIQGFWRHDDTKWARGLFGFSLVVLLVFSVLISLDAVLP